MIHVAYIRDNDDAPHCSNTTWISLDGDHWLPVENYDPDATELEVAQLFAGNSLFVPMTLGRSFLVSLGAEFEEAS